MSLAGTAISQPFLFWSIIELILMGHYDLQYMISVALWLEVEICFTFIAINPTSFDSS